MSHGIADSARPSFKAQLKAGASGNGNTKVWPDNFKEWTDVTMPELV